MIMSVMSDLLLLGPTFGVKNVTVPLGLWMFERPGKLRLNDSNVNFKSVY